MTDKEKIEKIREYAKVSWRELARRAGMHTPQTFTDIRNGRHGISRTIAEKLLAAYPEIRREWLLSSSGEMTVGGSGEIITYFNTIADVCIGNQALNGICVGSCFPMADIAVRYSGEGMKEYPDGCVLVLKKVENDAMIPGTNYLVITETMGLVRRMQMGQSTEAFSLYATSQITYPDGRMIYEPFEIRRETVKSVYLILGYIMPYVIPNVN